MISSPGRKASAEAKLRKSWVVEAPRTAWSATSATAGKGGDGEVGRAYLSARGVDIPGRCLVAVFVSRSGRPANIIRGAELHVGTDQVVAYARSQAARSCQRGSCRGSCAKAATMACKGVQGVTYDSTTVPSTWLPPALSKNTWSWLRAGKLARTLCTSMVDAMICICGCVFKGCLRRTRHRDGQPLANAGQDTCLPTFRFGKWFGALEGFHPVDGGPSSPLARRRRPMFS